ncbi:MAG: M28 family peptidase [Flavobacteriaceae bacterium]|nr:M28 family peptidase [Flavobacteriaceae bacterium]
MKKYHAVFSILIIFLSILWAFKDLMPVYHANENIPVNEFSVDKAMKHVVNISEKPHFVGSAAHDDVRQYILAELEKLGFKPEVQQGFVLSEWSSLTKAKNILARKKGSRGTGKALMLLTHYDSNPHSSLGASDAGSGVAVILESLRAFLSENETFKNDIIVLISDAEELGLNGAHLFVKKHPWAKEVGLVLNFEARGSGGPGYMLIETNGGNQQLIKHFDEADPKFPVANSLAYSIYKMLPNDTDLTVFREVGDIEGFNFAFIDDHFDYHTVLDSAENLNPETLAHQGSYLTALLPYFINADLSQMKSEKDDIYFNTPVGFFHYPFTWNGPLAVLGAILFFLLVFLGLKTGKLEIREMGKGFGRALLFLVVLALVGFYGWKIILWLYPDYKEILHGFTYNGHYYIAAFVSLVLYISFSFYRKHVTPSQWVAPYFIWLILCIAMVFKLPGAAFFIVPFLFSLLGFWHVLNNHTPNLIFLSILNVPALFIFTPLLQMLPVGLGLKMLVASVVLTGLIFVLMLPYWVHFTQSSKLRWLSFLATIAFLIVAHTQSGFSAEKPRPNSLVYVLDADAQKAVWASYDYKPDKWTSAYIQKEQEDAKLADVILPSKYGTAFKWISPAPTKQIPAGSAIVENDTLVDNQRILHLCLTSKRKLHRINLMGGKEAKVLGLKINGETFNFDNQADSEGVIDLSGKVFLNYFVVDDAPLEIEWIMPANATLDLTVFEASFDLLQHELFTIPERPADMIPKGFVLNDAIVVKKNLSF